MTTARTTEQYATERVRDEELAEIGRLYASMSEDAFAEPARAHATLAEMGARKLIAKVRELHAAATPGPWYVRMTGRGMDRMRATAIVLSDTDSVCWTDGDYAIAADGRTLLPALADELEAALAREQSTQRTNETLAGEVAQMDKLRERLENAEVMYAAAAKVLGERARELVAECEAHAKARILVASLRGHRDALDKAIEDEREAHDATKARLALLDGMSEDEREATIMWLQHAVQNSSELTRRGATALLMTLVMEG